MNQAQFIHCDRRMIYNRWDYRPFGHDQKCKVCDNDGVYRCDITDLEFCSYECRNKEISRQQNDFENDRLAEIQSGGQV